MALDEHSIEHGRTAQAIEDLSVSVKGLTNRIIDLEKRVDYYHGNGPLNNSRLLRKRTMVELSGGAALLGLIIERIVQAFGG